MAAVPLRRNRDFVLLQAGQLLSTFGSNMSGVAYPLLVLAATGSAAKAGYVGAAEFTPMLAFSLAAGVVADRVDRKRLMIAADVVSAAAVGALAAAVLEHRLAFWVILAVAFVDSTSGVFFRAGQTGAFRAVSRPPRCRPPRASRRRGRRRSASPRRPSGRPLRHGARIAVRR